MVKTSNQISMVMFYSKLFVSLREDEFYDRDIGVHDGPNLKIQSIISPTVP
jgi:hypothetical protein